MENIGYNLVLRNTTLKCERKSSCFRISNLRPSARDITVLVGFLVGVRSVSFDVEMPSLLLDFFFVKYEGNFRINLTILENYHFIILI